MRDFLAALTPTVKTQAESCSHSVAFAGYFLCASFLCFQNAQVASADVVFKTYSWQDTVSIEHEDRIARLKRLASVQPDTVKPSFFRYVIPKDQLPPNFDVDIPVLRVVFSEKSFFDTDRALLRDDTKQILDIVAESLRREPPDVALFIAGHTDARGSDSYNYNLSVRRSNTVAEALAARGIGLSEIWRIGFGEALPLASNSTASGRAVNRRVEFLFAAKTEAVANWLGSQAEVVCTASDHAATEKCLREVKLDQEFEAVEVSSSSVGVSVARNQGTQASQQSGTDVVTTSEISSETVVVRAPRKITIRVAMPD